jgi:hypothetical protein
MSQPGKPKDRVTINKIGTSRVRVDHSAGHVVVTEALFWIC